MNDSVLLGRTEEILGKEAHDSLMEKLRSGETVGRFNRHELLDCELSGIAGYERSFHKISEILTSEYPETPLLQSRLWEGLFERYLHDHPELLEDEISRIVEGQEEWA